MWYLPDIGGGILIALIAILHVFVSHFAVGGGLYLIYAEKKGLREKSDEILEFTRRHARFFLLVTMVFGSIMGIDVQLITADEAYHDKDGSLFEDTGVILTTPPSSKVSLPKHTNGDTGAVYCHDKCSVPMLAADKKWGYLQKGRKATAKHQASWCTSSDGIGE